MARYFIIMFTINRQFVRFQDKLYEILRNFPEHTVNDVDGLKDFLGATIALRKDDRLFFCAEIEDAEITI